MINALHSASQCLNINRVHLAINFPNIPEREL